MIQIKYTRIILVSPYSNKNIIIVFFIQHTLKEEYEVFYEENVHLN